MQQSKDVLLIKRWVSVMQYQIHEIKPTRGGFMLRPSGRVGISGQTCLLHLWGRQGRAARVPCPQKAAAAAVLSAREHLYHAGRRARTAECAAGQARQDPAGGAVPVAGDGMAGQ